MMKNKLNKPLFALYNMQGNRLPDTELRFTLTNLKHRSSFMPKKR